MPEVALSGHGQPLIGGDAAQGHVRALVIVVPHPTRCLILYLIDRIEQLLRQPVIANGSIETLDISILLRLSGLNVFDSDPVFAGPSLHRAADILWAVIASNHSRLATPADDRKHPVNTV